MNSDRNPNKSQSTKQKSVTPKFYPTSIIASPPQFQQVKDQTIRKNKSQDLVEQKQTIAQKKQAKKSPISSIHNLVKQKSNLSGYFPLRQPQNYSLTINRKSTNNSLDQKRSYSKDSAADIKNAIELKKQQQNGPLPNLLTTELRKYMQKKDYQRDFTKSKQKNSKSKVKIVNGKYVKVYEQKSENNKSLQQYNRGGNLVRNQSLNIKSNRNKDLDLKLKQISNRRLNLQKKSEKISVKNKKKSRSKSKKTSKNIQAKKSLKGHSYSKISAQSDFNNNILNKSNRCLSINFPNRTQNQFFNAKINENASFGRKYKNKFSEGPQIEHIMVSPSKKSHSKKAKSNLSKSNKSPILDNTQKSLNLTKNFIENYTTSRVPSRSQKKSQKVKSKSQKSQKVFKQKQSAKVLKDITKSSKQKNFTTPQPQRKQQSCKKSKSKKKKQSQKKQKQKNSISQWVKIIQSGNPVLIKKKASSKQKSKASAKASTSKKRKSSSNYKIKKNAEKLMQARKNIKSRSKIIEKINKSLQSKPLQSDSFYNENYPNQSQKVENMFTIPQMTSEPQICNILQQYSPVESNMQMNQSKNYNKNQAASALSNIVGNPYTQMNTEYTLQFGQNSIMKTESSHATLKVDNYQINEERAIHFPTIQNQFKGSDQSSSIFNSSIEKNNNNNQLLSYQNNFEHNQQMLQQDGFKQFQNNNFYNSQDQQKQIQKSFSQIVSHRTLRSKGDHSTFSLSNRDQGKLIQKQKKQKKKSLSLKKKKCKSQKKSRSSVNKLTKKSSNNFLIGSNENINQSPYAVSTFRGGQIQTIPQNNDNNNNYFQTYHDQNQRAQFQGIDARNLNNLSIKSVTNLADQSLNQRQLNYSYSREGQRLFKGNEDIALNSDIKETNLQSEIDLKQHQISKQMLHQQMLLQLEKFEKRKLREKIKIQLQVEAQNQMKEINIKQENRFQKLKEQMKESLFEIKQTKARLDLGTQFSSIENKTTKRNNSSDSISEKSQKSQKKQKLKNCKMSFKNHVNKFTERIELRLQNDHQTEINKYKDKRIKLQILKERASKIIEKKEEVKQEQFVEQKQDRKLNQDLQEDLDQDKGKSIDERIKDKYIELNQLKTIKYQQRLIDHSEKQLNYLNQANINQLLNANQEYIENRKKSSFNNYINKKLIQNLLISARKSQRSQQRNSSKKNKNQMSFSKFSGNESLNQVYQKQMNEQKQLNIENENNKHLNKLKSVQKENIQTRNGPQINLTTGERQSRKSSQLMKKSQVDSLKPQESTKISINNSKKQNDITKNSQKSLHSSCKNNKNKRSISSNKRSSKSKKQKDQKTPKSLQKDKIFSQIKKTSQNQAKIHVQPCQTDVMNSKNSTIVHQCKASNADSNRPKYDDYRIQKTHFNRNIGHYKNYTDKQINIQDQEKRLRFEDGKRQPYQHELVSMKGSCSYASARSGMPFNIKTPHGMTGEAYQNSQLKSDHQVQQNFKNNENRAINNDAYSYQKQYVNNKPKQKVNSILKNSSAQLGMNSQASNLSWTYQEDGPFQANESTQNHIEYDQIQKLKRKLCPQSRSISSQDSDSDFELKFAPNAWIIRKV